MFRKKKKPPNIIVVEIPEEVKKALQIIDPSKSHVIKDVGSMPSTIVDGQIERSVGHINFNKTKSITRKFKATKIREDLEKRKAKKSSYYDDDGVIYLG